MATTIRPPSAETSARLFEGGRSLFPAMAEAIEQATESVWLETYIFEPQGEAAQLVQALERAALRGVGVRVLVDGVGTRTLDAHWRGRLDSAGVRWVVYAPLGALGLALPSRWRRMHRKLCVVDGQLLFCGGINVLDDRHDPARGLLARPRLDFAVAVAGPVAQQAQQVMAQQWWRTESARAARSAQLQPAMAALEAALAPAPAASAEPKAFRRWAALLGLRPVARASLVLRDNLRQRQSIERAYRRALATARTEVVVASAYFLPSRRVLQALFSAARRGVRVRLLLQGRYEYFFEHHGARSLYARLLAAGIEIWEYQESFLHAKVAVVDPEGPRPWATVGSSNLEPLSLLLAHEANVIIEDGGFARALHERLGDAIRRGARAIDGSDLAARRWHQRLLDAVALMLVRLGIALIGRSY